MKKLHLHFMGIGGHGISAVAQMAFKSGNMVTGCDREASPNTEALERVGIAVQIGHSEDHLAQESSFVDLLVISPAVAACDAQNPELLAARRRAIRVITWQELLGELLHGKCVLSVSGVHGKSTTTAMLSLMLVDAGFDPTCEIGAIVQRFGANYRLGKSQYCVNEADEFNHNFWHYHPRVAIVKSIEFEHPEFFADYEACLAAFEHFIRGMDMHGSWPVLPTVILNADNAGCLDLRAKLYDWPGRVVMYHVEESMELQDETITFSAYALRLDGETSFRVKVAGLADGTQFSAPERIDLQLPGVYNVENALAALTAAYLIGVDIETIVETLEGFRGTRRRFEIRHQGELHLSERLVDVMLVDDYAHHPTAISATLEAARRRYVERRLVAVYQPHMYSRTRIFFEQFLSAFDTADIALIADIFPARERDTGIVHGRDLVAAMAQRPRFATGGAQVLYGGDIQNTVRLLHETLRSGDLVLLMGAGDIYRVTELLLQKAVPAGRESV